MASSTTIAQLVSDALINGDNPFHALDLVADQFHITVNQVTKAYTEIFGESPYAFDLEED